MSEGKNGKFEPIARPGGLRVVDCSVLVLKAGLYFSRALVSRDIPLPSLPPLKNSRSTSSQDVAGPTRCELVGLLNDFSPRCAQGPKHKCRLLGMCGWEGGMPRSNSFRTDTELFNAKLMLQLGLAKLLF